MTRSPVAFAEASKDDWSAARERLLQRKIADIGLRIEGTYLEAIVGRLYDELERAGIRLKPKVYLSDEWACPDGVPVIGIPFYLADPQLSRIEDEMMDGVEAKTDSEILSYLRHEAGHAFNYAYKLYDTANWRDIFGDISLPYRDEYTPQPFSRNFVRHIPGWYAQKHPDEDFSETFAVWLTPDSNWREAYRGWGCYKKLCYVESIVHELGQVAPLVSGDDYDFASEALVYSVADHYARTRPELGELPVQVDAELRYVFRARTDGERPSQPMAAHEFFSRHRRDITSCLAYWTGLYDLKVRSLIVQLSERTRQLGLHLDAADGERVLIEFVAFATTLCMNRLYKGAFVFNEERNA